jgi:hypothetical protein
VATTISHKSFFWGALVLDEAATSQPAYPVTDYVTLGDDATVGGGVGVRRATLVLDRSGYATADDAALMHFDFLNLTSDSPDDTWTSADFAALEGRLNTWWNTIKGYTPATTKLTRYYWHRVGAGITKPNPAIRITDIATPVASAASTFSAPPQAACSISLRHGVRRAWGRTYLPMAVAGAGGRFANADADAIVAATVTLLQGAKLDDFLCVVTSIVHNQAFVVEKVVVDNTVDIIRRRRFKHTTYIKSTTV